MSLQTFFLENQVLRAEDDAFELRLSSDDLKHFKVLRLRASEHVAVVDAEGVYYECELVDTSGPLPEVRIAGREARRRTRPRLTLFQGLPKGTKMDDIVRHATEVGADAFVPVAFSRSIVDYDSAKAKRKGERWQTIAKSAAMQAGRYEVPCVETPVGAGAACEMLGSFDCVIVFWEGASSANTLSDALAFLAKHLEGADCKTEDLRVAIVVGPEGGLAEEEVESILASNPAARISTLGPHILRTETAAIVGCALVLYELQCGSSADLDADSAHRGGGGASGVRS